MPRAADKPPSRAGRCRQGGAAQVDEFAEAAALVTGPAGNPECVWLGRRVVGLLWRDDMDTAFRHLDLYDRFGCPGPHIQAAFRCVVRQGTYRPQIAAKPQCPGARLLAQSGSSRRRPPPAAPQAPASRQPPGGNAASAGTHR